MDAQPTEPPRHPSVVLFFSILFIIFLKFIYFERENMSRGRAESKGERGSQAGSTPSVQSWTCGSNLQTVRSRPELKSDAGLSPPGALVFSSFKLVKYVRLIKRWG